MPLDVVGSLSLRQRLLSGSIWALAGKVANAFVMLAVNALLARLLSPKELGVYFLAFSVVSFGALLGSLGLNQVVVRFVAQSTKVGQFQRTRRVVKMAYILSALGAAGAGLTYLLFGKIIGDHLFHAPALAAVAAPVAVWIAVFVLQTFVAETFRGYSDIRLATVLGGVGGGLIGGGLLSACLGLLWLLQVRVDLVTVVLFTVCSSSVTALLGSWWLIRRTTSLPRGDNIEGWISVPELLHTAWPLLIASSTMFIAGEADIWIMGAFRAQQEVAVYGAAARVVLLVGMPLVILNSVLPPLIAGMYAEGKRRELERTLRATATLAGIPAALALTTFILFGKPILGLVYGDYYRSGAAVMALLSLGQLVVVWTGSCGFALAMTGHQRPMMNVTVACGLATIVAGFLVVGPYGGIGVAATTAAGLIARNLLLLFIFRSKTGIWTHAGLVGVSELLRMTR
jgi:O-antigen/teichoic acid export membrane protein